MWKLATLILLLAALIAGSQGQGSKRNNAQHKPSAEHQESENSRQPRNQQTAIPENNNASTTAIAGDTSQHKTESENQTPKITDWIMVGLTAAYVFVSVLLFCSVKRQADISQVQADATKKTADSLINIERPWLLVTAVERGDFFEHTDVGTTRVSGAYFVIKNYGKSPAWITSMGANFVTVNSLSDLPPEPHYKTIEDSSDKGKVIVPITIEDDHQRFSFPHESNSDINHTQLSLAIRQKVIWCAYGFVVYTDIFGETRETRFCHTLTKDSEFLPADAGPAYTLHK